MSTVAIEPLYRYSPREKPLCHCRAKILKPSSLNFSPKLLSNGITSFCKFKPHRAYTVRASSTDTALLETFESSPSFFKETFSLARTETVSTSILLIRICNISIDVYAYLYYIYIYVVRSVFDIPFWFLETKIADFFFWLLRKTQEINYWSFL